MTLSTMLTTASPKRLGENSGSTQLFDVKHLAQELGIPVRSARYLISQNLVPHVRIGRRIFIPQEAWTEFLQQLNEKAIEVTRT